MPKTEPWRNRIIGHGTESPDQLLANPANWRIHPKHQQDALSGVLDEIGWIQSVIVNQRSGFVVDGHLRAAIAISHNETAIPVVYVDLTDAEETLALATIDPIGAMAATDKEQLDNLLRDVSTSDAAVMDMLSTLGQQKYNNADATGNDLDDVYQGMPEFVNDSMESAYRVIVHFETHDDLMDFGRRLGQTVTEKTRSTWHPYKPPINGKEFTVSDES